MSTPLDDIPAQDADAAAVAAMLGEGWGHGRDGTTILPTGPGGSLHRFAPESPLWRRLVELAGEVERLRGMKR